MFAKIKMKLLNKNKIGPYIRYAIGEIILIVIGVSIAISLNNWNKKRQQEKVINGIFSILISDMKSDTVEVSQIIDFYNKRKSTFLKVTNDLLSKDEIIECNCTFLIATRRLFSLNIRGFNQLRDYKDISANSNDTLVFKIIDFYSRMTVLVENQNDLIDKDIIGNLVYWRDSYPWFSSFLQHKLTKEELSYFGSSQEYRNKVAYHYVLIFKNYIPVLKSFQNQSEKIISKLNSRLLDFE